MNKQRYYWIGTLVIISVWTLGQLTANSQIEEHSINSHKGVGDTPFDKMMAVLTHQRCVNCHPAGDSPLQGEDSHVHNFDVVRGHDDHGLSGYTCNTCHQSENNDYSGVPGAPHWAVAPKSMAWEGKSRVEIATQMMDPTRNGGRSPQDVMKHLTEHELVLWAWNPGVDDEGLPREKPPVAKDEYIQAVKDWIAAGAIIPAE